MEIGLHTWGIEFRSWNIDEYREMDSPVNGMDLLDVLEMLVDWKAAGERHKDGCIYKSL